MTADRRLWIEILVGPTSEIRHGWPPGPDDTRRSFKLQIQECRIRMCLCSVMNVV